MIAIYSAVIFFVCLDRWFKALALAGQSQTVDLAGQILKFNFKANRYIAFSLPLSGPILTALIGLAMVALIVLLVGYCRRREFDRLGPLGLVIFGAGSNLLDRFKHGYVVDYLDLKYFTVFNLADAMITAGVIWLMVILYKAVDRR